MPELTKLNYSAPSAPAATIQQRATNWWAIASIVTSLMLFWAPVTSGLAVLFGCMGLRKARRKNIGGYKRSIAGLTLGALGLVFGFCVVIPAYRIARVEANLIYCQNNLRLVGQSILQYGSAHNGEFPTDLASATQAGNLNPHLLVCPDSGTQVPGNWDILSPAQQGNWINNSCDFIYMGNGVRMGDGASAVIALQRIGHPRYGAIFLYADGHVDNVQPQDAGKFIARTNQIVNSRGKQGN